MANFVIMKKIKSLRNTPNDGIDHFPRNFFVGVNQMEEASLFLKFKSDQVNLFRHTTPKNPANIWMILKFLCQFNFSEKSFFLEIFSVDRNVFQSNQSISPRTLFVIVKIRSKIWNFQSKMAFYQKDFSVSCFSKKLMTSYF